MKVPMQKKLGMVTNSDHTVILPNLNPSPESDFTNDKARIPTQKKLGMVTNSDCTVVLLIPMKAEEELPIPLQNKNNAPFSSNLLPNFASLENWQNQVISN